jgi:hypothetical protein
MAASAYMAIAAVFFVAFVACVCWSAVAVVSDIRVVVAVACMCATLVASFGMVVCHLATRSVVVPAPRTIEIAHPTVPRLKHASVFEDASVALAVCSSPTSASPKLCVFEPLA